MTLFATDLHSPALTVPPAVLPLLTAAREHGAVRHPWLEGLAYPGPGDTTARLRVFASEFHTVVLGMPRCFEIAMLRLPKPEQRIAWQQRLAAEHGWLDDTTLADLQRTGIARQAIDGVPRSELFRRFALAVGVTAAELARPSLAGVRFTTKLWSLLDHASPAVAVGALALGSELVERDTTAPVLRAVLELGTLHHGALPFFELACHVDAPHQALLHTLIAELAASPGGADALAAGMHAALDLRREFLDSVAATACAAA